MLGIILNILNIIFLKYKLEIFFHNLLYYVKIITFLKMHLILIQICVT
jgi:hypothetical protein